MENLFVTRLKRLILGSRKKIMNLDYRLDRQDTLDTLDKADINEYKE